MAIFSLGGMRRCAGCSAAVRHRFDSGSERISGAHPLHQLFRRCGNRTDCGDGCGTAALRPEHALLENGRLRRFHHVFHLFSGGGDAVSGRQVGSGQFVCAAECRRLFWRCASGKAAAPLALCSVKTGGHRWKSSFASHWAVERGSRSMWRMNCSLIDFIDRISIKIKKPTASA